MRKTLIEFLKPNVFKGIFLLVVVILIALTPNITNYINYPIVDTFVNALFSMHTAIRSIFTTQTASMQELWIVGTLINIALVGTIYLIGCAIYKGIEQLTLKSQKAQGK